MCKSMFVLRIWVDIYFLGYIMKVLDHVHLKPIQNR